MEEDNAGTALYAAYQTTLYSAPRVVNGLIPKNVYGNLDVYVPSMVPPGGTHIPHRETSKAAKIIGVDYADAITGFSFKGRHGTAITNGAVVASEYREAIEEVLRTFENDRALAEEQRRTLEALRMWKKLFAGLRIRQRIEGYEVEGERNEAAREEIEKIDEEQDVDKDEGGGFFLDKDLSDDIQPPVGSFVKPHSLANFIGNSGGGFIAEDRTGEDEGGGFMAEEEGEEEEEEAPVTNNKMSAARPRDPFLNSIDDDDGGGFMINDDDADAEEAYRDTRLNELKSATDRSPDVPDNSHHRYQRPSTRDVTHPQENAEVPEQSTVNEDLDHVPNQEAYNPPRQTVIVPPNKETTEPNSFSSYQELPELPSAGLPDSDIEEAKILEQIYATSQVTSAPRVENTETEITTTDQPLEPHNGGAQMGQAVGINDTEAQAPTSPMNEEDAIEDDEEAAHNSIKSPESDKGSLLSHDPEDEDAEPEWLA